MTTPELTERQRREREYYDRYSGHATPAEVSFDSVTSAERRPWNPYWYVYDVVIREAQRGARSLLDCGCGTGEGSVKCARLGYEVHGFDISPVNVARAEQLADRYGYRDRTHFSVQVAERLEYPSESFDVAVGLDILHHVEIGPAVAECMRVLKPGGVAVFREWIEVPAFDAIRNTRLVRWLVPNDRSESDEHHITDDERKLNAEDLRIIRERCDRLTIERFQFLSRLDRFFHKASDKRPSRLERLDSRAFRAWPALARLGGSAVLILEKGGTR